MTSKTEGLGKRIDKLVKLYGEAMQTEAAQYPEWLVTDQILKAHYYTLEDIEGE